MIDLTVSRTKEVERINSAPLNQYNKIEANSYYRMEDDILSPLAKKNELFKDLSEKFKSIPFTERKVKILLKDLLESFKLSDIKIKISRKKSLLSYYSSSKQIVFINQYLLKEGRSKELLYVLIHELAHAYTCLYFFEDSAHDSFFLKNQIRMLSFITKEPEKYFTDNKVEILCTYKYNHIYKVSLKDRLKKQPFLVLLDDEDLYIEPYSKNILENIKTNLSPLEPKKYGCRIFNDFYDEYYFGEYFDNNFVNVKIILKDDNRFVSYANIGKLLNTTQEQQQYYIENAKIEI